MGKAAATAHAGEVVWIKRKLIGRKAGFNLRSNLDLDKIERLAVDMKARGQLQPIAVRNSGPKGQPYTVVFGSRRLAAHDLNGVGGDTEIMCVVREYDAQDPLGPLLDNWAENEERETVDYFDKAERVHQFVSGTYPVDEGQAAEPIPKLRVAELLNLGHKRTVEKLVRVFRNTAPAVVELGRKHDIPSFLWIRLSQTEGSPELDTETRTVDRDERQMEILQAWIAHKEELTGEGRQRARRGEGEDGEGEGEGAGGKKKAKAKKKADAEVPGWGAIDPAVSLDRNDRTPADYFDLLTKKGAQVMIPKRLNKAEQALVEGGRILGAQAMMRLLAKEISRVDFVTAEDWKLYAPHDPAAEEAEEDVVEEA